MREPSLGELAEDFQDLKSVIQEFMRTQIRQREEDRREFVNKELYETRHLFLQERMNKAELKDGVQDEALKRIEDNIDARFSRIWTTVFASIIAPFIIGLIFFLATRGLQ